MKALTAIFLLASLMLAGCAAASPATTPTAPSTSSAGTYSRLDPAGIEHIKKTKSARFDMSSGKLSKESVGLEDGTSQAPDVLIKEGLMELNIETPTALISAKTDRLRLNGMNKGPDFREVTYFLKAESFEDFTALIRDGVDRYGIPGESAEGWIESMSSRQEDEGDFSLAPGTSTGLRVSYDLRYDGSKEVQVIIVHIHPV
ncbi:conserved exported hypothetical protein [Arthrobacter sp. 9V]|uniref:hypothetical protein n=1 Tax=Arthrobacter sp. 9V TaxID=2653132 RepID=UPI0012EFC603|nr:hypothetical protein [Arthrobacter sp. 9V]VXC65725.1 conserved exported hypothetical protein [Arthrobacter sp. 9V]